MTRRVRPTVAMIEEMEDENRHLRSLVELGNKESMRFGQDKAALEQEIRELRRGQERTQSLADSYIAEVSGLRRQQEALIAALTLMEASRLRVITELEATRAMLKQTDRLAIAS